MQFPVLKVTAGAVADEYFFFELCNHRIAEIDALKFRDIVETARREGVDLQNLVADDIEAHQEHPVLHQFRTDCLRHGQNVLGDFDGSYCAAAVHVGPCSAFGGQTAEGGIFAHTHPRPAIHQINTDN